MRQAQRIATIALGAILTGAACGPATTESPAGGAGGSTAATTLSSTLGGGGGGATQTGQTGQTGTDAPTGGGGAGTGTSTASTTETCSSTWSCAPTCSNADLVSGDGGGTLVCPDNSLFDAFGPMTLTAVSADGFELLAPTGDVLVMGWSGPDPTAYFVPGDPVSAQRVTTSPGHYWSWIQGNGVFAAAWTGPDTGTAPSAPADLPIAPDLHMWPLLRCASTGPSCTDGVYDIVAEVGATSVQIATNADGNAGPYKVHNGGARVADCDGEDSAIVNVTVLGVVGM